MSRPLLPVSAVPGIDEMSGQTFIYTSKASRYPYLSIMLILRRLINKLYVI